jgi:hypothetical protein
MMQQWAIKLMSDTTVELSESDLRLLRFGPQPWLPHEVLRYNVLRLKVKPE